MANERRLIDVSKLVKPPYAEDDNITGSGMTYDEMDAYNLGIDAMWSRIQHYAPTVDAVKVVRCKDCKYYFHYGKTSLVVDGKNVKAGWCQRRMRYDEEIRMLPNDLCSYGEKREGGTQPQREQA